MKEDRVLTRTKGDRKVLGHVAALRGVNMCEIFNDTYLHKLKKGPTKIINNTNTLRVIFSVHTAPHTLNITTSQSILNG
jgi:hypothetical protein